ncbi:MAG: hypothetical protein WCS98_01040 [Bacillota bacterium]|nr:hypothetical protein [Bacillota bacterium]MDD3297420.1 hypothetical protein [Bacillota bacterium]MDD3850232.1 hypothetical protein [Bacillota bacterium]MDD4707189.1 hypothetical protein [Bacillota bacterium]
MAAHGLGLGAVWCGLYPKRELTEPIFRLLGLPPAVIPIGVVAVGHGDEQKDPADRYDKSKIHPERW